MTALQMWRAGKSYDEIAWRLGLINGGAAERAVSEQRSAALSLPSPYENPALALVAGTRGH